MMNERDSFAVEFELADSAVDDIKKGRPPGGGSVRVTTANGTERCCLTLFTYSVEQFLEAVPEMLRGGHGAVSTEDTTYIVLELEEDDRSHVTLCFDRDAVSDPDRRLLPRSERPLDTVVPVSVLVDEIVTAVGDLLKRIERLNESSREYEWFRDLNAELDDVRNVADNHLS